MNQFKAGDKIKVKENFWEIKNGIYVNDDMKKLAGRTLEVESVYSTGNVHTKQDDSGECTSWGWDKNWIEPYNPTITWDTLKWKDVVVDKDGDEQMVLLIANDLVFLSYYDDFESARTDFSHKQQLQDRGYTIKQPTPPPEKLELTLDQIAEKFGVDVTNIKIKK